MDDDFFKGLRQTSRARIETLKKIVAAFHKHRATTLDWKVMQDPRRTRA